MCAVRRRSPPAPKPIRQRIYVHEAEPFEGESGHRHRSRIDDVMHRNRRVIGAAVLVFSPTTIFAREAYFEIESRPTASATLSFTGNEEPFAADRIASATHVRTTRRETPTQPDRHRIGTFARAL